VSDAITDEVQESCKDYAQRSSNSACNDFEAALPLYSWHSAWCSTGAVHTDTYAVSPLLPVLQTLYAALR
jgi:hypothetical protein